MKKLLSKVKKHLSINLLFRKWYLPQVLKHGVFLTDHQERKDINQIKKIENKKERITPFAELIPIETSDLKDRFLSSHTYVNRDKYVYEIKNALLAGPYGLVCTSDKRLVRDTISFNGTGRVEPFLLNSYLKDSDWFKKFFIHQNWNSIKTHKDLQVGLSLCSVWINYFHWIVEELPKLRALENYYEQSGIKPKIVIPSNESPYIRESLKCMGYEIKKDTISYQGKTIRLDKLIVQTFPEITPELTEYIRNRVLKNLKLPLEESGSRRIYLSRDRAGNRNLTNKNEIMSLLKDYGFEEMYLEDLTFEQQVKLIHNSSVIVSCHSAGLTNIIWGKELRVVELFGHTIKTTYARLCEARGHTYRAVAGEPVEADHRSNFFIEKSKLETILSKIGINKRNTKK